MSIKRIIPCLDVKDGRVVKGTHFIDLRDAGDPVELAAFYDKEGADEITFLDINATVEGRKTTLDLVKRAAQKIHVPLIVGGGISDLQDISALLKAGADKVSLNTAAVKNPDLIYNAAKEFGSQRIVLACDVEKVNEGWEVYIGGGNIATGINALEWVQKAVKLGAGEVLLTSIETDGTKDGYDIELLSAVSDCIDVPIIASGGAGKLEHFRDAFTLGEADAALAASIFHFGTYSICEVKQYLRQEGIEVRL